MTRPRESEEVGWILGATLGGVAVLGGIAWVMALWPSTRKPLRMPADDWPIAASYTEADVEAAARMLASENPRGTPALHVEQIHSQLRSRRPGQSLYDRITAGSGWGPQGQRGSGGIRPVATTEPATEAQRRLVREVLDGLHPSVLSGARKFFDPVQQDRAFVVAERARRKQADGQRLTPDERRLLGYRRTAQEVRSAWRSEGAKYVGAIDGVEFFT